MEVVKLFKTTVVFIACIQFSILTYKKNLKITHNSIEKTDWQIQRLSKHDYGFEKKKSLILKMLFKTVYFRCIINFFFGKMHVCVRNVTQTPRFNIGHHDDAMQCYRPLQRIFVSVLLAELVNLLWSEGENTAQHEKEYTAQKY